MRTRKFCADTHSKSKDDYNAANLKLRRCIYFRPPNVAAQTGLLPLQRSWTALLSPQLYASTRQYAAGTAGESTCVRPSLTGMVCSCCIRNWRLLRSVFSELLTCGWAPLKLSHGRRYAVRYAVQHSSMTADLPKLLGAGLDHGDFASQDLKVTLAHKKFILKHDQADAETKKQALADVEKILRDNDMSSVYEFFCTSLGWQVDQAALDTMKTQNTEHIAKLDEKITESEKNMGDEEVRDAMLEKADYLANIGDKEKAWEAYDEVEKKTPSANQKLTILFCKLRLEILYGNWSAVKDLVTTGKELCGKGGDWEKKNRLMVRSIYAVLCKHRESVPRSQCIVTCLVGAFWCIVFGALVAHKNLLAGVRSRVVYGTTATQRSSRASTRLCCHVHYI